MTLHEGGQDWGFSRRDHSMGGNMTLHEEIAKNRQLYGQVYRNRKGMLVTAEWDSPVSVTQARAWHDEEAEFCTQLATFNRKAFAMREGFANVPCAAFDFLATAYLVGLAYGNRLVEVNNLINAEPLFLDVEGIRPLVRPKSMELAGVYPVIFSRIRKFQQWYPDIPITISDNQSPVDVLTQIIHSEAAMLAMYDDPDILHTLLDQVTESIIEVNRKLEKEIHRFGGFQRGDYLPFGMHVSDDNAAFLSPGLYREFALPYIERLSEAFGGIAQHCCMGHAQNLDNICNAKGFLGYDAMPDYNPMNRILSAIEGKGVWNVANYPWTVREERQKQVPDLVWFKDIIDKTEGRCGLILNVYAPQRDTALALAEQVRQHADKSGFLVS